MPRQRIPMTALRHIAAELISSENRPLRSKNRPASKVRLLREMMANDKDVAKKVADMYRQRQANAIATEIKNNGMVVNLAVPAADDGNEGIWIDPWSWVIRYTDQNGAAGWCKCGAGAATWIAGTYLCINHAPKCHLCPQDEPFTAWWQLESSGTFVCRAHKPAPPPDVEV